MLEKKMRHHFEIFFFAGLLSLGNVVRAEVHSPSIDAGEFYFAIPGSPKTALKNKASNEPLMTLKGGASGEIKLIVENTGNQVHEISSALLMVTEEVEVKIYDKHNKFVAEIEAPKLLELELAPGFKAEIELKLANVIIESLQKDPDMTMTFEIACHIEGHYQAGMRSFVVLAP